MYSQYSLLNIFCTWLHNKIFYSVLMLHILYFVILHFNRLIKGNFHPNCVFPFIFPWPSVAHWPTLGLFWEWGTLFISSGHGQIDKNKNRVFTLVLHKNDHWTSLTSDAHHSGRLETILPIVLSPQQALFTQVCSGTQLHSTQTNSLTLNKWAIDFCLFSEQPGAFWTTIASPI